jgi:hypothetical protein
MSYSVQGRWRRAYALDFTTQSSQNIRTGGNGSKTIDGKTWTWANDTGASTANITNGTGYVVALANTASANPQLSIPVSTLFPSFSLARHALRVSARVLLTNSITNFEMGGVGLTMGASGQAYACIKGYNGAANCILYQSNTNTIASAGGQTDDIVGYIYAPPAIAEGRSGTYTAGLPLKVSTLRGSESQQPTATPILQGTPKIFLQTSTSNSQGLTDGFVVTFTYLQVDYMDRIPPVA